MKSPFKARQNFQGSSPVHVKMGKWNPHGVGLDSPLRRLSASQSRIFQGVCSFDTCDRRFPSQGPPAYSAHGAARDLLERHTHVLAVWIGRVPTMEPSITLPETNSSAVKWVLAKLLSFFAFQAIFRGKIAVGFKGYASTPTASDLGLVGFNEPVFFWPKDAHMPFAIVLLTPRFIKHYHLCFSNQQTQISDNMQVGTKKMHLQEHFGKIWACKKVMLFAISTTPAAVAPALRMNWITFYMQNANYELYVNKPRNIIYIYTHTHTLGSIYSRSMLSLPRKKLTKTPGDEHLLLLVRPQPCGSRRSSGSPFSWWPRVYVEVFSRGRAKVGTQSWKNGYLVGGFDPFEKYARQIGSIPPVGMEIKNIWNHQPAIFER